MEDKDIPLMITSESLRALIKKVVGKLGPQVSREQKIACAKLLVQIFEQGIVPRAAMNISDIETSQIYSFAYRLFNAGQYAQALEVFKMLLMLSPVEGGFAVGLGACYHRLGDYDKALQCYMLGWSLEQDDPVPLFYAYDCYLKKQDNVAAGIMLCNVIARAGNREKYAQIKKKAQLLLDGLEKQLTSKKG